MNPREVLGLRLWLVSHEMSTSWSPTEQFEICVSGAYFRGIWIPECGGHVTDRHNESSGVTQTALICFVYFIKNSELRHRRFRSIPRNPISYVNTVDFPHNPDLLKTGASVKNW